MGAQLLDALLLAEEADASADDGVDGRGRVRVVAGAAVGEVAGEVEAGGVEAVARRRVAVEQVDDERQVAVGGQPVGDELAVGPDGEDVGQVEEADARVRPRRVRHRQVAGVGADLDVLARGRASVALGVISQLAGGRGAGWRGQGTLRTRGGYPVYSKHRVGWMPWLEIRGSSRSPRAGFLDDGVESGWK